MSKQLYIVEITLQGIVLAESEKAAQGLSYEISHGCTGSERPHAYPLGEVLPNGWDENSLIFHEGGNDIMLWEARELIEKEKERTRQEAIDKRLPLPGQQALFPQED